MLINESSILLPKNYYSLLWYFFPVYAECVSLLRNWFSTHYYESIAKNSRLGAVCVRFGAACQVKWSVDSFFARGSQLESVQKMNLNDPSRRPSSNRVYNAWESSDPESIHHMRP